jgi:hypothetical protein
LLVFDYFGFGVLRCPHCITLFQVLCLRLFYFSVPSSLKFSLVQCCTTKQRQVRRKLALLWLWVWKKRIQKQGKESEKLGLWDYNFHYIVFFLTEFSIIFQLINISS